MDDVEAGKSLQGDSFVQVEWANETIKTRHRIKDIDGHDYPIFERTDTHWGGGDTCTTVVRILIQIDLATAGIADASSELSMQNPRVYKYAQKLSTQLEDAVAHGFLKTALAELGFHVEAFCGDTPHDTTFSTEVSRIHVVSGSLVPPQRTPLLLCLLALLARPSSCQQWWPRQWKWRGAKL